MKDSNVKYVANDEYLPVLTELIETGKEVSLPVAGGSMSPFLKNDRDSVIIAPIRLLLKKGDVVFYKRKNGQFVLHRIKKISKDGSIFMIGDAQDFIEGPLSQSQMLGVVNKVCRNGKWIGKGHITWWFYRHIWLWLVPFRRLIFRIYGAAVGRLRK